MKPNNFRAWSLSASVYTDNDFLTVNNTCSISETNYYFGKTLKTEIHEDYTGFPYLKWTLYNEKGIEEFHYTERENSTIGIYNTSQFCYPQDSCFTIEIKNPFYPRYDYCPIEDYIKYDVSEYPIDHEWLAGDTVYFFGGLFKILVSEGWIGHDIFMHSPMGEPDKFENIYLSCENGIEPDFKIIDETAGEVIIHEFFDKNNFPETYSYDHCLFELSVGTKEEIIEKNWFTIYPNPGNSTLNISANFNIENVLIYSVDGRLELMGNSAQINVSQLYTGLHFVVVNQNFNDVKKYIIK